VKVRSAGLVIAASCLTLACCAPQQAVAPALDLEAAVARRQQALATVTGAIPSADVSAELRGRYVSGDGAGDEVVELFAAEDGLALRMAGVAAAPVRAEEGSLRVWIPTGHEFAVEPIEASGGGLLFRGGSWRRDPGPRPAAPDAGIEHVLGRYEPRPGEGSLLLDVLEWEGNLWLQVNDMFLLSAEYAPDGMELADNSLGLEHLEWVDTTNGSVGLGIADGGSVYRTLWRTFGVQRGPTFKIEPVSPVAQLREAALAASPPTEGAELRAPELVELAAHEPGIRLDIRYATTNNFMGAVFYEQPRAFMQRPAAEALGRVQRRLAEQGYGLLVYDAYRPWFATKMFWDATPEDKKQFVADPANGSRHNRGCAVDLTLVDLATGQPVDMTGGYDEFTERSYTFYPGGTDRQRWHRELLRRAMEAERFAVYEYEWWHFDFHEWAEYPILDRSFDSLEDAE